MKCRLCGNEIPDGAKFCEECGTAVETESDKINLHKDYVNTNYSNHQNNNYNNQNRNGYNNQNYNNNYNNQNRNGFNNQNRNNNYNNQNRNDFNHQSSNNYYSTSDNSRYNKNYNRNNNNYNNNYNNNNYNNNNYNNNNYNNNNYNNNNYNNNNGFPGPQFVEQQMNYQPPVNPRNNANLSSPCHVNLQGALSLFFKNASNFSGRSTRSELFFSFIGFLILLGLLVFLFVLATITNITLAAIIGVGIGLLAFAGIIPFTSCVVRRLHDSGKSGLFLLLLLLVPLGWFALAVLLVLPSQPTPNQFGPPPDTNRIDMNRF